MIGNSLCGPPRPRIQTSSRPALVDYYCTDLTNNTMWDDRIPPEFFISLQCFLSHPFWSTQYRIFKPIYIPRDTSPVFFISLLCQIMVVPRAEARLVAASGPGFESHQGSPSLRVYRGLEHFPQLLISIPRQAYEDGNPSTLRGNVTMVWQSFSVSSHCFFQSPNLLRSFLLYFKEHLDVWGGYSILSCYKIFKLSTVFQLNNFFLIVKLQLICFTAVLLYVSPRPRQHFAAVFIFLNYIS